jgi:adenosyl cobinamide kinase/adenosyl cobinamide phosphate guanylyltransferase
MTLTLLIGGARSGKSRTAERLVSSSPGQVALIATAEARDEEMEERIRRHRSARPAHWVVVEEPLDLSRAIGGLDPDTRLVVDCLTLWVSNLTEAGLDDEAIEAAAADALAAAQARGGDTVVVSNEVGSGIVPMNALSRRYRDLLGRVNAIWADGADRVLLCVAGGVVPVDRIDILWDSNDG